jgi:hypothetical protein
MTDYSERFLLFWSSYPKRVGKGAAWKAWVKLDPPALVIDAMLTALAWQIHQPKWRKDGGEFIPYPATWLNARRWEDEPLTATGPAKVDWWDECKQVHGVDAEGVPVCGQSYWHHQRMARERSEGDSV